MNVTKDDPIGTVRYVLETLETQAVAQGSHPVLIHEAMEALDKIEKLVEDALLARADAEDEASHLRANRAKDVSPYDLEGFHRSLRRG